MFKAHNFNCWLFIVFCGPDFYQNYCNVVFTKQSFCMDVDNVKHQNNMAARFLINYHFSEKGQTYRIAM